MRYRLRTLLLVMMLGGPLFAWTWFGWKAWQSVNRPTCQPGLKQIGLALHAYRDGRP